MGEGCRHLSSPFRGPGANRVPSPPSSSRPESEENTAPTNPLSECHPHRLPTPSYTPSPPAETQHPHTPAHSSASIPMTPPPDAQHTVHARHLQVIPLPARLRDPLPRHKPELRTTPGENPSPPSKLNPANPHKKSNPRKAEAKDIAPALEKQKLKILAPQPQKESQEAKCSSSFV